MQSLAMQTEVATDAATSGGPVFHDLEALRTLVETRCVTRALPGEPDFRLASGRLSRYYCDTKKITLSPEGAKLTGEVLFRFLDAAGVEAVGGLQLGATFIATAVALVSFQHHRPIYGFTVRERQKEHGTKETVAASFHPDGTPLLRPGRRVAVVDDVVTGGNSILKAVDEVLANKCELVAVVSLVDRKEGGGEVLRSRALPYYSLFYAREPGVLTLNADLLGRSPVQQGHTI
jgi:orotate phosphoribosyltransferase